MLTVGKNNKFDWKKIPLADCLEGNSMDAYFTLKIYSKLKEDLEEIGLLKLYEKLLCPLANIFANLEMEGMLISKEELAKLDKDIGAKLREVDALLKDSKFVPEDCNLSSPQQLIGVLYSLQKNKKTKEWDIDDSFGFGMYPPIRTSKGQPSTDDECLKLLQEQLDQEVVKRNLHVKA